jgi:hypothetical protein
MDVAGKVSVGADVNKDVGDVEVCAGTSVEAAVGTRVGAAPA